MVRDFIYSFLWCGFHLTFGLVWLSFLVRDSIVELWFDWFWCPCGGCLFGFSQVELALVRVMTSWFGSIGVCELCGIGAV